MFRPAFLAALSFLVAGGAVAQSIPKDEDLKRYRKRLEPGSDAALRMDAIKNVAFYDSEPMVKLLVDSLAATLKKIDDLQAKRAAVDAKIDAQLKSQIEKAGRNGAPNYAGVEELQTQQKSYGTQITTEEQVVRRYVEALGSLKNPESLALLMELRPKNPPRLRPALLDALGLIRDGRVAEFLITQLEEERLEVRLAATAALLRQDPRFVPASALAPLLRSAEWQERSLAIDALAKIGDRTALDLLVAQTAREQGRLLEDLGGRLEQLTGQKFGRTAHAWVDWWQKSKGAWQPNGIDITQPMRTQRTDEGYASFWGITFDSLRCVYVVDISGSMVAAVDDFENTHPEPGKSRFELARRELKASISGLPPDASFNVIAYSDVVIPWKEGSVLATKENKKEVFEWLDGLGAVGQTNIFDALERAFQLAPAAPGSDRMRPTTGSSKDKSRAAIADTILFLSDGSPTCGRTIDCEEILTQVKEWNETRRISIHTVGIGKQVAEVFLRRLAEQNGGRFVLIDK